MSSDGGPDIGDLRQVKTGGGGGGGGGGGAGSPCDIVERTRINSPDPTVKATVRVGDVLDLVYEVGPPKRLLARTAAGSVLGSITSPASAQIIQCIIDGLAYVATVIEERGGLCDVEIRLA